MTFERAAPDGPQPQPEQPVVLDGYTLLAKVASGGMATVYVGRRQGAAGFERLVALKCCHPHLRDDDEFVAMFLDEARLAASIRHPNVVGTLDVSVGTPLYLVMEYVEGFSLAQLAAKAASLQQRVPLEVVISVLRDTLTGLHAAHELRDRDGRFLNLVHRDVSPHNVLVGVDGVARITDFGVAFALARASVTREGHIKGKFAYLAPEQIRSQPATRRMDVFSAGIVLWEMLTGRTLFRREDELATVDAVLRAPVPAPSSIVSGLPSALDAIALKALEREPDDRYQTAAEFAEALERLALPCASARAVSAHIEGEFEAELTKRRRQLRLVSDVLSPRNSRASSAEAGSEVSRRSKVGARRRRVTLSAPESEFSDTPSARDAMPTVPLVARDAIAQRRVKGGLAAALLLLIGSALGLLLSRSSPDSGADRTTASGPSALVRTSFVAPSPGSASADTQASRASPKAPLPERAKRAR